MIGYSTPPEFRYLDFVARLAARMDTRDVLYFNPREPANPAELVVSVCPPEHEAIVAALEGLTISAACVFVKDNPEWWIAQLAPKFEISYMDPGYGYPLFVLQKKKPQEQYPDHEVALYDLSNRPATFDIVNWLSLAKSYGAKHVRFVEGAFKQKNYSDEQAAERYHSILKPAVALFGMDYSVGEPYGVTYSHIIDALIRQYRQTGDIAKIALPCEPKDYVTITLRRSRTPGRDSNEAEWREFAKRLTAKGTRVLTLRDYDEVPLELNDRAKLYAGAKMNFFVSNGPAMLCICSDIPYLIMRFICGPDDKAASPQKMKIIGIEPGFQYPWANPRQRISYLDDTADNIEAEYAAMPKSDWRKAA